jgi:hypothetical protein
MQVNTDAEFFQHHDTVHHVDSAAIIGGPWNIEANNM